jgi:hypothetical protein
MQTHTYITLNDVQVERTDDNSVVLRVPVRELTNSELEFIYNLFPHHGEQISRMLNVETLIACLAK